MPNKPAPINPAKQDASSIHDLTFSIVRSVLPSSQTTILWLVLEQFIHLSAARIVFGRRYDNSNMDLMDLLIT
jgi:hypothetical protein